MKASVSFLAGLFLAVSCMSCHSSREKAGGFSAEKEIDYCRSQAALTLSSLPYLRRIKSRIQWIKTVLLGIIPG